MYDKRLNLANQVADEARRFFGAKVYDSVIPRNVKLSESPSFAKPILYYDAQSTGAESYMDLAREVIAHAAFRSTPRTETEDKQTAKKTAVEEA
jgi:chromosome partitioning protein